jgi:LDH2 family malate/lactate/ureidoglycolate dehydrogenase
VIGSRAKSTVVSVAALQTFCERVLKHYGVSPYDATTAANVLVTTDSWGVFTHGTKLLAGYIRRLRDGGLQADCSPLIEAEGPAWAIVNGQSTLGQVASCFAMRCAIDKARHCGVAYVGVHNSCHFGAAGYYTWLAAQEDMIGLAMSNDVPSVAAPGSRGAVLGSNPIAYAIPTGRYDPLLLDISTATVAGGKVYAHLKRGESIPEGWLIGPDGRPTCDGSLYPAQAALAPMSGHKGYGIGLLIEILAGVLTGAAVTRQIGSWLFDDASLPTNHGAAFLVLNIESMMARTVFEARMDSLIEEIHSADTVDGCEGVLLPGEREWKHRRSALANGLCLPDDVVSVLDELGDGIGLDFREFSAARSPSVERKKV